MARLSWDQFAEFNRILASVVEHDLGLETALETAAAHAHSRRTAPHS